MRVKRTASMAQSVGDIERMGTSWMRHLRAENKAAQTLTAYGYAWSQLRDYLVMHGLSLNATDIRAEHVEAFLADVLEHRSPATANNRYRGLQQFFAWLAAEREILESPMLNVKPPRFPDAPVPVPSAEDVKKLLATCDPETFEGRRDAAIIRLFARQRHSAGRTHELEDGGFRPGHRNRSGRRQGFESSHRNGRDRDPEIIRI
jgi:integrase